MVGIHTICSLVVLHIGNIVIIICVYDFYAIVAILIDLHSQNLINIYLFELVDTCIKIHIFIRASQYLTYLFLLLFPMLFINLRESLNFKYSTL